MLQIKRKKINQPHMMPLSFGAAAVFFAVSRFAGKAGGAAGYVFLFACALALLSGIVSSVLWYRKLMSEKSLSLEELERGKLISELVEKLLGASGKNELYETTLMSIYSVADCPSAIFVRKNGRIERVGSYPEGLILYPAGEELESCFDSGVKTGRGTPFCGDKALSCYPVSSGNGVLAVVGILFGSGDAMFPRRIKTIESLLVKAGIALDRFTLMDNEHRILVDKEIERMRSDFLRTISHDLRTPLTGIIGACSVLEQDDVELSDADRRELIVSVSEESQWLLRMVENLLSVTRVGAKRPTLNITEQPVEELLSEVLEQTRRRFPKAKLSVTQPSEFLMIPMDAMLIVQVLMNLIDNAVKYAGTSRPIELSVSDEGEHVSMSVRDYGGGINDRKLPTLFEASSQRNGDSGHGMGLGLSLCRSIIRAHCGSIEGCNAEGGGARFTVKLPKGGDHGRN